VVLKYISALVRFLRKLMKSVQGNGQYEVHNNAVWISVEHCTEKYFHIFILKGLTNFCHFHNFLKLHVELFVLFSGLDSRK